MTPFAPRAPYKAVAVASFKTEKFSITSEERAFKSPVDASTPSIKIRGEVGPANVDTPRIQKLAPSAPGSPLLCTATTPAIRPANELLNDEEGTFNVSGLTVWIEPTTLAFFCVPKPTTTTSSNVSASSSNTMINPFSSALTAFSTVLKPMNENWIVDGDSLILILKLPSISLTTPLVVPLTTTFAPGIGSPVLSLMIPVTVNCFCCW